VLVDQDGITVGIEQHHGSWPGAARVRLAKSGLRARECAAPGVRLWQTAQAINNCHLRETSKSRRIPEWPGVAARLLSLSTMTWVFTRGDERLEWEVRRSGTQYELRVQRPDGTSTIHSAATARELLDHVNQIPQVLLIEGWRPVPASLF